MLNDSEIRSKIESTPPILIENLDLNNLGKDLRGCSIDLHIGGVFRPGVDAGKPGSATSPFKLAVCLKEGETAIIKTRERFNLDLSHAAFVFPVSSISIKGLLMTNPGHIDPGYKGEIHVTVINMGKEAFSLEPDSRILRSFLYRLDSPATISAAPGKAISQELLDKLSPDFLSVNSRAASAASSSVNKASWRIQAAQFVIPVLAGIITWALTNYAVSSRFEERIKSLETINSVERLKTLELNYPTEKRLLIIEEQLKHQSQAISTSQSNINTKAKVSNQARQQ